MKMSLGLVALVAVLLGTAAAEAARFSLVGVGTYGAPAVVYSGTTLEGKTKLGTGGGVLMEFPMSGGRMGLEVGAIYAKSSTEATNIPYTVPALSVTGTSATTFTYYKVTAPVMVRFWLTRWLNIGAGAYVSSARGSIKETGTFTWNTTNPALLALLPTSAEQSASFGTIAHNLSYGGVGAVGMSLPLRGAMSLRLDGVYTYGLNDQGLGTDRSKES